MRIIAGENKGLSLKSLPGVQTRPTTDKVKESIFNRIGPFFQQGSVLDLYAGSGGLGLEALSRGMGQAIFVDVSKAAIQVIRDNVKRSGYKRHTEIYKNEAFRALKALRKRKKTFDLIFLDPPYAKERLTDILVELDESKMLNHQGIIVCEHDKDVKLPGHFNMFQLQHKDTYGGTVVTIYKNNEE